MVCSFSNQNLYAVILFIARLIFKRVQHVKKKNITLWLKCIYSREIFSERRKKRGSLKKRGTIPITLAKTC